MNERINALMNEWMWSPQAHAKETRHAGNGAMLKRIGTWDEPHKKFYMQVVIVVLFFGGELARTAIRF
jgi:hypothetical protein